MGDFAYLRVEMELNDISLVGLDLFGEELQRAIVVADSYDLNEARGIGIVRIARRCWRC